MWLQYLWICFLWVNTSHLFQQSTTWSGANVNINLDNLSPASKFQRTAAPSMIQLQQSGQNTQAGMEATLRHIPITHLLKCLLVLLLACLLKHLLAHLLTQVQDLHAYIHPYSSDICIFGKTFHSKEYDWMWHKTQRNLFQECHAFKLTFTNTSTIIKIMNKFLVYCIWNLVKV